MWGISSGSWLQQVLYQPYSMQKPRTTPSSQNRAASNTSGNVSFLLQPRWDFPISAAKEGEIRMPAEGRGRKRAGGNTSQSKAQLQGGPWRVLAHHSWTPGRWGWRWSGRAARAEPHRWQRSGCCPAPRISSAAPPATAGHSHRTESWSPAACNSQEKALRAQPAAAVLPPSPGHSGPAEGRGTGCLNISHRKIWDISLPRWLTRMLNQLERFYWKTTNNHSSFR